MKILITGGAGFIGSHLADYLLEKGYDVKVVDNLSFGSLENIKHLIGLKNFEFIKGDLRDSNIALNSVKGVDVVYHLAANPEVRIGEQSPDSLYDLNVYMTYILLEAMRKNGVKKLAFTSSSTVYGDAKVMPTPENYAPLEPISIYGGAKLASEAIISAYSHTFNMVSVSFRLANVIGKRSNHGVIHDFIEKLKKDKDKLEILGDGTQSKSYIHVKDVIEGMFYLFNKTEEKGLKYDAYNVGSEDQISVMDIAKIIVNEMGLNPKIYLTGGVNGGRGWVGDVKYMLLSIEKAKSVGWKPKLNSYEAVKKAVREALGKE
jgi:UDP-glucose 4-epimerase